MGKNLAKSKTIFFFCDGGSCRKAGSEQSIRSARAHLRNKGLWDETHTIKTRCNGRCEDAPTWIVQQGGYWYKKVSPDKGKKIIDAHCEYQCPLVSELLFYDGQLHVDSEDERRPPKQPSFKLIYDEELGEGFKAKGFHSDQYLYPLFLFLKENPGNTRIVLPDYRSFDFSNLQSIDYTDAYQIKFHFGDNEEDIVRLVIALVPKTGPLNLIDQRVSACEYFIKSSTDHKTIRLRDKNGHKLATIEIPSSDYAIWQYCLKIQLNNATSPKITEGV